MGDRKDMIEMDRKNTLLLTVIAIATLLVAVVGATFAFFTSQVQGKAQTDVSVTTQTVNSSAFNSGDPIYLRANMANFSDTYKNVRIKGKGPESEPQGNDTDYANAQTYAVSKPSVKYDIGSGTTGKQYLCYTAKLVVEKNTFEYSAKNPHEDGHQDYSTKASENSGKMPELVITIKKDGEEIKSFDQDALKYLTDIVTIRTYDTIQEAEADKELPHSAGTEDQLNGFDITKAEVKSYDIVNPKSATPGEGSASNPKLFVLYGEASDSVEDQWEVEVTIVNYDFNQNDNASVADGKTVEFQGKIVLESAETCPEDAKIAS